MRTTTTARATTSTRRRRTKRSEDCLRLTTTTTNIANVPSNQVTGMGANGPAHSPRSHCWGPSNSVAATIAKSSQLALLAIVLLHLTMAPSQCHTTTISADASNHRSAGILEIGRQRSDASSQHTVANYNQPKSAGVSRNLVLIQQHPAEQPDFVEPIGNHTVAVGRDAQLACKISNLGNYRTAWLRVEDKGILTIHNNVITRNYRFGLMNNEDESSFVLTIRNVQPSDKGGYMCQINSVPMKYAVGYLDVLTPPVFDETSGQASSSGGSTGSSNKNDGDTGSSSSESDPSSSSGNGHEQPDGSQQQQQQQQMQPANSSQVTVVEGSDATLSCLARGHPKPTITWRREDGRPIIVNGNELGSTTSDALANAPTEIKDTSSLTFVSVNRFNSGAYLCIASNGVQPSASKRQLLDVQYSPTITVPETEISGWLGEHEAQLECYADSNPGGSYHWVKLATSTTNTDRRPMVANQEDDLWLIEHDELMPSDKFDIVIKQINSEKVRMILIIRQVDKQDFSWYKCIAKNSLGLQSNFVRFYEAPMGQQQTPAAAATTTTTTASSSFSFKNIIRFNDFIGGGGSSQTTGQQQQQQQQQDDNKLNLPQNDDSRLSFQRSSSSSSSSARSAGSVSPIGKLLHTTALGLGSSVTLQSYLLHHCQFAALFSLVMITTLLNLLSATTGTTTRLALGQQQQT